MMIKESISYETLELNDFSEDAISAQKTGHRKRSQAIHVGNVISCLLHWMLQREAVEHLSDKRLVLVKQKQHMT